MRAWSGEGGDVMGPDVPPTVSAKVSTPPLKNGSDLRESGYLIAVGSRTARFRRKHRNKLMIVILIALLLLLLCLAIAMTVLYIKQKRHKGVRVCESKECLRSAANLALSMDRSANPCDDFYQYVCGNWAEDHPRPDLYHSYDWFRDKQGKVYALVRDFLGRNSSAHPLPVRQAKDMYAACMDTETLDKRGLKPVIEILQSLGLPSHPTYTNITEDIDYEAYTFDWLEAVIKVKTQLGMDVLIGFDIFSDPKNSSLMRLVMGSPETTNPFPSMISEKRQHSRKKRRHFTNQMVKVSFREPSAFHKQYSKKTEETDDEVKTREIYKLFYAELIKLFILEANVAKNPNMTEPEVDQNILQAANYYFDLYNAFYELESDNSTDSQEAEELELNLPEYTVDELQAHTDSVVESNGLIPSPIWRKYLEGIFSISNVALDLEKDKVLVSEPDLKYLALMAAILAKTPPVSIELYVWIKVVEVMAAHTTTELRVLFQRSYNDLRDHSGDVSSPSRSLQCASAVNDMMGMAVAYAVADPHFLNVTRPKINVMLNEMKNALSRLVGKAKWMDDDTKLATYEKIVQMKTFIGFPDWLLEEGKLEDYYAGVEVDIAKHLENMINIIQVKIKTVLNRFRDANNHNWATDPTEVNAYHTFQENTISRRFDKNGNLLPWWTNRTIESFVNITQCFVDQYSSFLLPELGEHVDGKRTLGENIADNGGVREALGALREHLRRTGPETKLPGFEEMSSEKLFFLSYGNLWCGVSTKESLQSDLEDEHSPQMLRAKGALQNNADFAKAWRCPVGSAMNPGHRCIVY